MVRVRSRNGRGLKRLEDHDSEWRGFITWTDASDGERDVVIGEDSVRLQIDKASSGP